MDINKTQEILEKFSLLPKRNTDPTFMEISHLWNDRFEERCSKILRFYLNSKEPHGFNHLFLISLLDLLPENENLSDLRNVSVRTEEVTEDGKRIDIIVEADNFVIAIENKIGASLYNPLESYVKHINTKYPKKEKHFIVLSARQITNCYEKKSMQNNKYENITYHQYFDKIRSKLGNYILTCNQAYLNFALDFIKTIENKYYNINMESLQFFYDNKEKIEELIREYNAFNEKILSEQCAKIADIKNLLNEKTESKWWVYQNWDLGITFNENGNKIGIESSFGDSTRENPLGDFHVYITVWKKSFFEPYREELKKRFPTEKVDEPIDIPNRIYLHLPVVKSSDANVIANKLLEYYDYMKELTDRIK